MIAGTPALKTDRRLVNADELGQILGGKSAQAIYQHRYRGHIPESAVYKFGPRLILFDPEEVLAALKSSPLPPTPDEKEVVSMS